MKSIMTKHYQVIGNARFLPMAVKESLGLQYLPIGKETEC